MRKVVFLINSLTGGGAERIMARLITHAQPFARGSELHLILLDDEPSAYSVPDWIRIHRLSTGGSFVKGLIRLRRKLAELQPRVCVSFLVRANLLALLAARRSRTRVVISQRSNVTHFYPDTRSGRFTKTLIRLFFRRADSVIAVSDGTARDLIDNFAVPPARIVTIPNPIDADELRAKAAEGVAAEYPRPLVVSMGRLVPGKNFQMLIDAFHASGSPGTLVIFGQGDHRERLEAQIKALGLGERVLLPGFSANPFAQLASADCYVLPSDTEGFPNGLVEAMVLGVPVVSTNCHSGPSEILDDRSHFTVTGVHQARHGILVPVGDTRSMAEALRYALDPANRPDLAERAATGAGRYELHQVLARYWREIDGGAAESAPAATAAS